MGASQQLYTACYPTVLPWDLGTNHSPTKSFGYLGFGLNGSPMVEEDLCNSHMSIACGTVERGQLILGREKGLRAQYGMEGQGSLR